MPTYEQFCEALNKYAKHGGKLTRGVWGNVTETRVCPLVAYCNVFGLPDPRYSANRQAAAANALGVPEEWITAFINGVDENLVNPKLGPGPHNLGYKVGQYVKTLMARERTND